MTADDETVAILDNEMDNALHYFDDEFHRYLETGASTFDLSILKRLKIYSNANKGNETDYQHLKENNSLVFTHKNRDYKFTIRRIEETEYSMRLYCENLSLDLINEYRGPIKYVHAYGIAKYINDCINESGYEIGINEFSSNVRTLEWESSQTVLARILSICNSFGAEIEFETILNYDRSVKKNYIHLKKRVGENRQDVELKYGRDVTSISRVVDINDLYTAIKPRGSEKDGKLTTIRNIEREVKNSNGVVEFYTKKGSDFILAPLATEIYGYKRPGKSKGYVERDYEYDTESDSELFNRALTELKKHSVPRYEFEIEGYYDVNVGDTVRAIDEAYNPILLLEARISEQIISFSDPSRNKTIYSNYKVLENKVNQSLLDRVNQLAALANQLKYGIDFEGSTVFKNGQGSLKLYADVMRGELHVADEFTSFNWIKKNADGTIDEIWTQAHTDVGKVVEILPSDVNESATFSFTILVNEEQQGNATIVVSNVYDGKPGDNGKDTYIDKSWSWSADGTDRFTTKYPNENLIIKSEVVNNKYIDANNNLQNAISSYVTGKIPVLPNTNYTVKNYSSFKNLRVMLYDSNDVMIYRGDVISITSTVITPNNATYMRCNIDTQTGKFDNDAKIEQSSEPTIYTPSPKDDYENAYPKYEGYYSSHNPVQSTNPSDYTWTPIPREPGKDGEPGQNAAEVISGSLSNDSIILSATSTGVVSDYSKAYGDFVVFEGQNKLVNGVTYSKVSEIGMTSSINASGRYTVTNIATDTAMAIYRATYKGVQIDKQILVVKNKQGTTGSPGVGVSSTKITYQEGISGTTTPTGTWSESIPTVSENQFLWTRTITTYSDNSSSTGYSVSKMGGKGAEGVGVSKSVITYSSSTSGVTPPTSNWVSTIPTVTEGNYLWTRTVLTFTDNTTNTSYSVAKQGSTGPQGPPTGITTSATVPTNPYIGMLWQNTGTSNGYVYGVTYRWTGAKWDIYILRAENIVVDSLSALAAYLGDVEGGSFTGGKFINDFVDIPLLYDNTRKATGRTIIENGVMTITGKIDGTYDFITKYTVDAISSTIYYPNSAAVMKAFSLSPDGLLLIDHENGFDGQLLASSLTKTPWVDVQMRSGYSGLAHNMPKYKVTYNLDGTRTIRFRGQIVKISGSGVVPMDANTNHFFGDVPSELKPSVEANGYGVTDSGNGSRVWVTNQGGMGCRIGITKTDYVDLSNLNYIID